jgi:hypothetical protein
MVCGCWGKKKLAAKRCKKTQKKERGRGAEAELADRNKATAEGGKEGARKRTETRCLLW